MSPTDAKNLIDKLPVLFTVDVLAKFVAADAGASAALLAKAKAHAAQLLAQATASGNAELLAEAQKWKAYVDGVKA